MRSIPLWAPTEGTILLMPNGSTGMIDQVRNAALNWG